VERKKTGRERILSEHPSRWGGNNRLRQLTIVVPTYYILSNIAVLQLRLESLPIRFTGRWARRLFNSRSTRMQGTPRVIKRAVFTLRASRGDGLGALGMFDVSAREDSTHEWFLENCDATIELYP